MCIATIKIRILIKHAMMPNTILDLIPLIPKCLKSFIISINKVLGQCFSEKSDTIKPKITANIQLLWNSIIPPMFTYYFLKPNFLKSDSYFGK